jgi:hypothetical protein
MKYFYQNMSQSPPAKQPTNKTIIKNCNQPTLPTQKLFKKKTTTVVVNSIQNLHLQPLNKSNSDNSLNIEIFNSNLKKKLLNRLSQH